MDLQGSRWGVALLFVAVVCGPQARAEKASQGRPDPNETVYLDDMVVTATSDEESTFDSMRSVTVVDRAEIEGKNQLSILDTLDDRIGVWIEKRTATTSDPVIRGLSGANLLALIDRNTLTTMWGEGGFAGDDMYGKIDAESIERIEVVRGPSSVLYGTNALGGVINFISREPPLDYTPEGCEFGGRVKGSYGSAAEYGLGRAETWGASPNVRYIVGVTGRDIDNMRAGGDVGEIDPSGGRDRSGDIKGELMLGEGQYLDFSSQVMHRPEVYRSYRPNQVNRNDRTGLSLGYRSYVMPFFDEFEWRAYHQYKKDEREWLDSEREGVARWSTYSSDLILKKELGLSHELTGGLHYHLDLAESPDDEQFTITTPATGEQKASPDTDWHNVGVFLQDQWRLTSQTSVIGSIRYDSFRFGADENVFYTIPGSTSAENVATTDPGTLTKEAVTGGLGLLYEITESWNVLGSWFRGYRLFPPSFGLRQTGYGLLAPNGLLDPVTGDTYELSTRIRGDVVSTTLTGYYTDFHNFQQPVPGTYNGMTSYDFDGSGTIDSDEGVFVNAADGDAYVTGVELECEVNLGSLYEDLTGWRFFWGVMWNYGRMQFPDEAEEPLRHTHPIRGLVKLRYDDPTPKRKWWVEFVADMVDQFDQVSDSRLNGDVGYRADPQDPASGLLRDYGLPGYTVLDLRGGYRFTENMRMTAALENILDKKYRSAHSRMDAPGRNFVVGLEARF